MNHYDQRMRELRAEAMGSWHGCQPIHVTEEEFDEVEKILDAKLPDDYREFVRDYGNYRLSAFFPGSSRYRPVLGGVAVFSGIVGKQHEESKGPCGLNDIIKSYQGLYGEDNWPEEWLPIASGDGSDFYVLAFKGENKGTVHYIVDATLESAGQIAESFDEFIHLIQLNVDDES